MRHSTDMTSEREDKYSIVADYRGVKDTAEVGWFTTTKIADHIYLTSEHHFLEANRCNIWLVKG